MLNTNAMTPPSLPRLYPALQWSPKYVTAGTGLFTASENGWEIYWSLFKFPNHLHRETIVQELIISSVRILLYYLKYLVNNQIF